MLAGRGASRHCPWLRGTVPGWATTRTTRGPRRTNGRITSTCSASCCSVSSSSSWCSSSTSYVALPREHPTQTLPTSPADPPRADDVALVSTSQTHYLRGKRAERMRARGKMQMTGAMQGGGVAGLSQLRAKLSGKSYDHAGYERLSASSMEEGAGGSLSRGNLKRTGSGSSFGSGGSLLESVRYLEQQKGGGGSR